jgi:hypothetical protein
MGARVHRYQRYVPNISLVAFIRIAVVTSVIGLQGSKASAETFLCAYSTDRATFTVVESSEREYILEGKWTTFVKKVADNATSISCRSRSSDSGFDEFVAFLERGGSPYEKKPVRISWTPDNKPVPPREAKARKTAKSGASAASITVENIAPGPAQTLSPRKPKAVSPKPTYAPLPKYVTPTCSPRCVSKPSRVSEE